LKLNQLIKDQHKLARCVKVKPLQKQIRTVAGADVSIRKEYLFSWIGLFSYPELELIESGYAKLRETMPYIPGFLSYRELPVLVKAFKHMDTKPDLVLVDGQGIAHPRGLGLGSHLGVALGYPTIGCAKSHLYGAYTMPGLTRGSYRAMKADGRQIGIVLRTRDNVKPVFVSPGHRVDFDDCLRVVLSVTPRYRIPEPIRYAHKMAGLKARAA
jgi:deoxyribonuclease V